MINTCMILNMRLWRHLAYKSWLSPQAALGNANLMITTIFISLWDTLNIWNNHARLRRSVRNKNDSSAYLCFISPNDSGWKPCDCHNFTLWDIQMILSRVIHEVVYACESFYLLWQCLVMVNISVLILKDVLMISYMYSINIVHLHDDKRMCLSSVWIH